MKIVTQVQSAIESICTNMIHPMPRYQLMVECWQSCPDRRPSFRNIANKLENILENSEDYLGMNTAGGVKCISDFVSNNVYGEYENNLEEDPLITGR